MSTPELSTMDELPPYECTVAYSITADFKPECITPFLRAPHRSWSTVKVCVDGTRLSLTPPNAAHPQYLFTLQAADVGRASDYGKRPFALRIRAEGFQFLLASSNVATAMAMFEALGAGIAISLPLEDRLEPRLPSCRTTVIVAASQNRQGCHPVGPTHSATLESNGNPYLKAVSAGVRTGSPEYAQNYFTASRLAEISTVFRTKAELIRTFSSLRHLRYDSHNRHSHFVQNGAWIDAPDKPSPTRSGPWWKSVFA